MTIAILVDRSDAVAARAQMHRDGIDFTRTKVRHKLLRRLPDWTGGCSIDLRCSPASIKAWDVMRSVDAVVSETDKNEWFLDLGSLHSEVPLVLDRLGHGRVAGCDVDPRVLELRRPRGADLRMADATCLPWTDNQFGAVVATSMIEHGVAVDALMAEVRRVLRLGGIFAVSTDYWPTPLDTNGEWPFSLPWRIFDRAGIEELIDEAARQGLAPLTDSSRWKSVQPTEPAVRWRGRRYTFIHLTFRAV